MQDGTYRLEERTIKTTTVSHLRSQSKTAKSLNQNMTTSMRMANQKQKTLNTMKQ